MFLLTVVLGASLATTLWFRAKRGQSLKESIFLLNELHLIPLEEPMERLQERLAEKLNQILIPFETYARIWLHREAWNSLHGVGEHPAWRPGAPAYLPAAACPAYAMRRPFHYEQSRSECCPSERFNYRAHRCLPVCHGENVLGTLFLGTYRKKPWDRATLDFFDSLAQAVALVLERKSLVDHLQDKFKELQFSFEAGAAALEAMVASTQSVPEATRRLLDGVLFLLKADRASLMLWDKPLQRLMTQWVRGGDGRIHSTLELCLGEGMAGWALETGEPCWAEYAMGDPHYVPSARPIQSLLCVPIFTLDHQPLGVLNAITTRQPRRFSAREVDFLKAFGSRAGLAIENAQLHQKNRAHIEQLKEHAQSKSHFLALISHDLRGPLTGVRGYCEILKLQTAGPLRPAQMELLSQLERQIDLQERMVDDLLDLARMEKGELSIRPEPVNLARLLEEEVRKSHVDAAERKVELTLHVKDGEAWPILQIDDDRIRQVTWNLIHNALKFTQESGRVAVKAWSDGRQICVEVSDTGIGLLPEAQERVFEKFFQVGSGGPKTSQGLGLGLAVSKEIILAHGGTIRASSAGLRQGTTLTFTLPLRRCLPAPGLLAA